MFWSVRLNLVWGLHVSGRSKFSPRYRKEAKVANLLVSGNGYVVKEIGWARLTKECEGEVSILGAVHLDTP